MGVSLFPSLPFICFVFTSDWPGASACSAESQRANKNSRSCLRCVRQHGVLGMCRHAQELALSAMGYWFDCLSVIVIVGQEAEANES
jgi:hypothetical protein